MADPTQPNPPQKRARRVRWAKERFAPEVYQAVYEALADPRRYTRKDVIAAVRAVERGEPIPF